MLGLLGVQFLLGMAVNLYVQLPPGGMTQMMRGSGPSPLLMIHMMLGMTLGAGALLTLWHSLRSGRRSTWCATVGLGGVLLAGIAGMLFLMGGQSNGASYLMAVGLLVAAGGYLAELVTVTGSASLR